MSGEGRSVVLEEHAISLLIRELSGGEFFASSEQAPGCWGHGASADEAADDFVDAYREWRRVGAMGRDWERDVLAYNLAPEKVTHWEWREFRDVIVTARTGGVCSECLGDIVPGTRIRAHTAWMDGSVGTARICHLCCDAMAEWTRGNEGPLAARYEIAWRKTRGLGAEDA